MENTESKIREAPTEAIGDGITRKRRGDCRSSSRSCLDEDCTRRSREELPPSKRRKECLPKSQVPTSLNQRFLDLEQQMCQDLSSLHFSSPVTHIYNPLSYATEPHHCYVNLYANSPKRVLFFGMNPGPFGMAQTGVGYGTTHQSHSGLYMAYG